MVDDVAKLEPPNSCQLQQPANKESDFCVGALVNE